MGGDSGGVDDAFDSYAKVSFMGLIRVELTTHSAVTQRSPSWGVIRAELTTHSTVTQRSPSWG